MRFDTTNFARDAKMYSVIGKKSVTSGSTTTIEDDVVQCGYFGCIGKMIEDDVYEFLPPEADKDIFVIATPEVDADESKVVNNTLKGFTLQAGDITDAIHVFRHEKFAIEEDGIQKDEGVTISDKGYVYLSASDRKLHYSINKPITSSEASSSSGSSSSVSSAYPILLAKIEMIIPSTRTYTVKGVNNAFVVQNLKYNLVRCRVL